MTLLFSKFIVADIKWGTSEFCLWNLGFRGFCLIKLQGLSRHLIKSFHII